MGKDKKKKGKGAEKTAEKTEKKLKLKAKKELAAKGEDDIESMVKAIEEEERRRQEVKEVSVEAPSHRSSFSITAHPDNPEIIFFGGEFYNGQKTTMFNDLLIYNLKRGEWSSIRSPAGPPPRSSHQAVAVSQGGGQLWVFGGEFTSPTESQFYHYKDLWCFHFSSRRWEKIVAPGGPSARSGHRMVQIKKWLVVFGGFHDNLRDSKYFNDAYAFDLENRAWSKLSTSGSEPSPRSACQMFPTNDGRLVVFGGYCKEKGKKGKEKGIVLQDMFLLQQDKHDEKGLKWRWQAVKQVGARPSLRTGLCNAVGRDGRVWLFGGVQDEEEGQDSGDESEDEDEGVFHNDLYTVQVEGERATWHLIQLTGKKDVVEKKKRRKVKEEGDDEEMESEDEAVERLDELALEDGGSGPSTVTVESGAFTVSSTITGEDCRVSQNELSFLGNLGASGNGQESCKQLNIPSPRFNAGLAFKGGLLYLFGGLIESGEKDYTLKDFYSLDTKKLDTWKTIIEDDVKAMEWVQEEDDDEDEDDEEEGESGMETD